MRKQVVYINVVSLLLCSILLYNNTIAQHVTLNPNKSLTQYIIKNWTIDDGLPSNATQDIIQDREGYIWIASYGGITRFDGIQFKTYNTVNNNAFLTEACKKIVQDKSGTLWIGTQKGILVYKNKEFTRIQKLNPLNNSNIEALFVDKKNALWIGTNADGLFKYTKDSLYVFEDFRKITNSAVYAISESNNNIWIGTYKGELLKYDNENFVPCDMQNTSAGIYDIFQARNGIIYAGTTHGVYTITNNKLHKTNIVGTGLITKITSDHKGIIWFSSSANGMYRYNMENQKCDFFDENSGLPNNRITKLIFDSQGNLWGTTYRKGFFQVTDGKFTCYTKNEGLQTDVATAIAEIDTNEFWIATETGNIDILKNGVIIELKIKSNLKTPQIKHILKDRNGIIWISTYNGLLKMKNGRETLMNINNGFPDNYIRVSFEDEKGNIWVGTNRTGLHKMVNSKVVKSFTIDDHLNSNYVMAINQDLDGKIWVGTKNGINIINQNKIIKSLNMESGLPDNLIFNIYVDKENSIWLSTNSGVCYLKDNVLKTLDITAGLPLNTIYDILEDDEGFFWLPCPKGIIKVNKKDILSYFNGQQKRVQYTFFNKSDGMKSAVCLGATKSLKATNGSLYFTTAMGIASIDPGKITYHDNSAPIIIEDMRTNGHIYTDTVIVFSSKQKRFEINYTALDYLSPEKIKFKYKLSPFEQDWVDAGSSRQALYTNIDPGTYKFQVLSTNSHGTWSKNAASIIIKIIPTWYQTRLFKLLFILMIFIVILSWYGIRLRSIKRKQVLLENLVKQRTVKIEQQKEEIQAQTDKIVQHASLLEEANLELEKLSIVASKTNNAITIMDAHGRFEWVNDGFTKFYELTLQEFRLTRGKSIFECTSDQVTLEKLRKCIKNKITINYEFSTITKSGRVVQVQTTITPILNNAGEVQKLISIDTDISQVKKAESEIIRQKNEIEDQKQKITDSIIYSKHIQSALFPTKEMVESVLPDSFIINMPKEIIGGDFYWVTQKGNKKVVAVADCTGHGVPGALMSMLGITLLNEIVNNKQILTTNQILTELRANIIASLHQTDSEQSSLEGMDIGVCVFDEKTRELEFSGANNPIIIIRNEELIELKADKIQVRLHHTNTQPFTSQKISLRSGDMIYMFSDGFADQFGGTENKKFQKNQVLELFKNIAHFSIQEQMESIMAKYQVWKGDEDQIDDILILGFLFK